MWLCRALIIYQDEFYKSDHDLRGLDAYGDLWCKIFFQLNQFRREAFGFLWVTPHPCCICLGPGLLAIEFEVGWTKKRQGKWAGWVEKEQPPKSCKIQKTVFLTKGAYFGIHIWTMYEIWSFPQNKWPSGTRYIYIYGWCVTGSAAAVHTGHAVDLVSHG